MIDHPALDLDERRWAAMATGDHVGLALLLADELVYTHADGTVEDKASYVAALESGLYRYATIERDSRDVRTTKSTAVITGRARIEAWRGRKIFRHTSRYTAVWASLGSRWLLVAAHSCPVRDD